MIPCKINNSRAPVSGGRAKRNAPGCIIRCKGLNPQEKYKEAGTGKIYSGSTLMYGGYLLPKEMGEYQSYQMYFERV